jgi:hypothetical protein
VGGLAGTVAALDGDPETRVLVLRGQVRKPSRPAPILPNSLLGAPILTKRKNMTRECTFDQRGLQTGHRQPDRSVPEDRTQLAALCFAIADWPKASARFSKSASRASPTVYSRS